MKKGMKRALSIIVTLVIVLLPFFTNANLAHAKDKHDKYYNSYPILSHLTKTLDYSKETFELSLSKTENVKEIKWYTSDDDVAEVDVKKDKKSALITSEGKGTAWIKVKITLKHGGSYSLGCLVIVKSSDVKKPEVVNATQAKLLSVVRSNDYTLTATFDKAIEIPGLVLLNNRTVCIEGVVDTKDTTKVNYTIPSEAIGLSGKQKVYIGYYSSLGVVVSKNTISKLTEVTVDFTFKTTTALPAPVAIIQDPNNNNMISIIFNQNIDKATAETVSNYMIDQATILSAELNNTSSGAVVKLKVKDGSIALTKDYSIIIYGVKGLNNSYTTMNLYQSFIYLKENVAPLVKSINYVYPTSIVIQFDEKVMGTANFKVLQNNKDILSHVIISGDAITLALSTTPENNNYLEVVPLQDTKITDLLGNITTSSLSKYLVPIYK
jgi:hypothetical protein